MEMPVTEPSIDEWLAQAKASPEAELCGMFLTHNGVVRSTPKRQVREGAEGLEAISYVDFSWDAALLEQAIADAKTWPGVHYVKVWLASGRVPVGGSLMYVLIGADIRPNCIAALEKLVGYIKNEVVIEAEIPVSAAKVAEGEGAEGAAKAEGEEA